jgi:hypothetical protein
MLHHLVERDLELWSLTALAVLGNPSVQRTEKRASRLLCPSRNIASVPDPFRFATIVAGEHTDC